MSIGRFWLSFFTFLQFWDFCVSQSCGSVLTESSGVIISRGHPTGYPSFHNCRWKIQANPYDQVDILFKDFNIEAGENCEYDWLEISTSSNSKKFCGERLRDVGYNGRLQLRGSVIFHLASDDSVNGRGFSLQYRVVPGEPPPTTPPPTTIPTTTPEPTLTCTDKPCLNDGECTMIDQSDYYCFCEDGFEGTHCEIDIDECASNPCQNRATCVDGINSWTCECVEGYIGDTCSVDIDDCLRVTCKNGGTCEDRENSFFCACAVGWTAWDCGTEIDECNPDPCLNHGVCEDHVGYYTCVCHPKFTGVNCSIPLETESTELPEKYKTPELLTPAPTTTVMITTSPATDPSPTEAELPVNVPSTTLTNLPTTQSPKEAESFDSTNAPQIPAQNVTKKPEIPHASSSSDDLLTTQSAKTTHASYTTPKNATNTNVGSNDTSRIPIPVIIGAITGLMSFVGLAASIFRLCNSSARPAKVQPMTDNVPRSTGPLF